MDNGDSITINGLQQGWTFEVKSATQFNAVQVDAATGTSAFKLGVFSYGETSYGSPAIVLRHCGYRSRWRQRERPYWGDAVSGSTDDSGYSGNDNLAGDNADNYLLGDGGNDTLTGNGGDNLLAGGSGNDT